MKASHALYVELATRISTQRLHYRAGDEETAAASLYSLFKTTRTLMIEHADEEKFQVAALTLLNEILRPYTARWHGWMTHDGDKTDGEGKPILKLRDECVRRKFREELRELQPLLHGAKKTFGALSEGKTPDKEWLNPAKNSPAYKALLKEIDLEKPAVLGGIALRSRFLPQVRLCAATKDGRDIENDVGNAILAAEHAHILERRKAMALPDPPTSQVVEEAKKSEVTDAFGLALSGGGIRSATFCLGVVQALHKRGLFRQVDYLSTVSGGGYLGTFLTSYLGHEEKPGDVQPPPDPKRRIDDVFGPSLDNPTADSNAATAEPRPLRHLRNNSKYLLNGGPLAILHIVAVFLNGVFAALLMLLSLPLVLAWFVRLVKWIDPVTSTRTGIFHQPGGPLLAALVSLTLLFVALRPFAQRWAEGEAWESPWVTFRQFIENTGNIIGLVTLFAALLCGSYIWVGKYDSLFSKPIGFAFWKDHPISPEVAVAIISALIPTLLGLFSKRKDGSSRKWVRLLFLLTGPLFFLITFTIIASHVGVGSRDANVRAWAILTVVLLLWMFLALNINTISLHQYYRDRLCECYLAVRKATEIGTVKRTLDKLVHGACPDRHWDATDIGTAKSAILSEAGKSLAVPYHLINAVINAPASRNPELRGRNGDFFLFSRAYCGSPLTGYLPTTDMEKANPGIDLGTAMAISGAAASTNMGSITRRDHRFLMTLFNIRLGYWMRRPGKDLNCWFFRGPGPLYFLREMTGLLNESTHYVNLSDGGHIENLAAYELLRRQCKFIVCVDAGMEPGMECADLMRLQRLAEIDFGLCMYFDPTDLTLLPTKYSRAYGVLVKIDYAPQKAKTGRETSDELGWMLYLKLAVTGTEPRHILDYRRQNPAFPHQTTGDQFYDEAQFESYRSLGQCAASSLFREEIIGNENAGKELDVNDWFNLLGQSLLSDNDEALLIRSQT